MTNDQVRKSLLELCRKGLGYMDQGMGHGHYGFNLDQADFVKMARIIRATSGRPAGKCKEKHPWKALVCRLPKGHDICNGCGSGECPCDSLGHEARERGDFPGLSIWYTPRVKRKP